MKSVLISIRPKWCELIASGKKTIEVRKTKPNLKTPFKVYIYETKGYDTIFYKGKPKKLCVSGGKVIGEFVCDAVISNCEMANADIAEKQGCIKREDLLIYAGEKELFGWHISGLVIYDEPRKVGEFYRRCEKNACEGCEHLKKQRINASELEYDCEFFNYCIPITTPPQSWCYVEDII